MKTVVILGASDREDRYAHKAQKLLMEHGYRVVPVHPSLKEVEGIPVVPLLSAAPACPDALTVYVRPEIGAGLADDILSLAPAVVIFNPGTEHPALEERLTEAGIRVVEACTIMLLTTGRFEPVVSGTEKQ